MHAVASFATEAPSTRSSEERGAMPLGRLWSRIVGLSGWDKEVDILHNVEGDGKPPPGETEETMTGVERSVAQTPEEVHRRYEEWPGEDPGH
jgi:hypothetical protein